MHYPLGTVKRHIVRADQVAAEKLAQFGVATVHEAMGRLGLMHTIMRPIYAGARVSGTAVTVLLHPGDNWMMHEKPKHVESGMNPFDYAKAEKRQKIEKQDLAQLKNELHRKKPGDMRSVQVLDQKQSGSLKLKEDSERKDIRKREHKSLMKSLTMAQISTASMGKFDRKLKREPEAPTS